MILHTGPTGSGKSMTLFAAVSPSGSVFERVLERYFDGEPDRATLRLLGR